MDAVLLARWQFGITTVYHFFFVPVTIGMTWLVAIMETRWRKTGNKDWLRLTKFFGNLFLINFAAGVVTGIVQEFQFGMNWSEYSRFVGDIFGAPLALEALIAFFMESTFIGLWIFGWDKLKPGLHNACMYLTALGSTISAIFILAANAFMQNPVGARYNPETGRAELVDFLALVKNPFFIGNFTHVISASLMAAGAILAGVAAYRMTRRNADNVTIDAPAWRSAGKLGAWVLLIGAIGIIGSGHYQAVEEAKYQPMKLAASEGLTDTTKSAPFSIVAIFTQDEVTDPATGEKTTVIKSRSVDVPAVLSMLAYLDPQAEVAGINDLTREFKEHGFQANGVENQRLQAEYASNIEKAWKTMDTVPNLYVTFYTFRVMMLAGFLAAAIAVWILVALRKEEVKGGKLWLFSAMFLPFLPMIGSSTGWILAEMGRQPWIVYGVLTTGSAYSPSVTAGEILVSMILYTLVYAVVAVIVLKLFIKYIKKGLEPAVETPQAEVDGHQPVSFAY